LPLGAAQRRGGLDILHIESIVNQLRAEGKNCDDHILSLTTPLMRKHLNPFARYYICKLVFSAGEQSDIGTSLS